jgi:hypothetical protein
MNDKNWIAVYIILAVLTLVAIYVGTCVFINLLPPIKIHLV